MIFIATDYTIEFFQYNLWPYFYKEVNFRNGTGNEV
jgi:hypothetical protein